MTVATNLSCFFGPRLVALLLIACVPAKASSPSANAIDLVTMKEIVSVTVHDPKSVDPPFASGVSDILPKRGTFYTTFQVSGEMIGESTDFDVDHRALVSIPLEAAEEGKVVECEIKEKRRFLPDRTRFTAKLNLIKATKGQQFVSGNICDSEGNDTGIDLKAEIFVSEWNRENMGESGPDSNTDKGDPYYRIIQVLARWGMKKDPDLIGMRILEKPSMNADANLKTLRQFDGLMEYPADDEFLGRKFLGQSMRLNLFSKVAFNVLNAVMPKRDRTTPVTYRLSAINDVRRALKSSVERPLENRWLRPLSDFSLERVFFSSVGMEFVQKTESGGYVADMTSLGPLEYKKKMENLGCKVYFEANGSVAGIENYKDKAMYRPGDDVWEWAKLKARTSIFIISSLDHLIKYHFIWGSTPGQALRMYLPPTHPIRMAFSVHFFRTHRTCSGAQYQLIDEFGILGRVVPFAYERGYETYLRSRLKEYKFQTYPDQLESQGVKDCSFFVGSTDGMALHTIMMNYASEMFDEVYLTEDRFLQDESMQELYEFLRKKMRGLPEEYSMANVKMVWGEILFRVTGGHNSIGNVAMYALGPFMLNLRMQAKDYGKVNSSMESDRAVSIITGNTMPEFNRIPTLNEDWSHLLKDPESLAYQNLKSSLVKLGEEIEERNAGEERRFINRDFDPETCAISVFS